MQRKIKIAIVLVVGGLGYGAYDLYDYNTQNMVQMQRQREAKEREIAAIQKEVKTLQSFAANIQTIKREFKDLNVQLLAALEHMPRSFSLSSLLRKMSMVAQNSGVELVNFKPKKGEIRDADSFYATTTIDFQVRGNFTQTLVFFDQLSRLKRIVNLESMKMKVSSSKSLGTTAFAADSMVSIRTYRFAE